jgi:hypothetical protein
VNGSIRPHRLSRPRSDDCSAFVPYPGPVKREALRLAATCSDSKARMYLKDAAHWGAGTGAAYIRHESECGTFVAVEDVLALRSPHTGWQDLARLSTLQSEQDCAEWPRDWFGFFRSRDEQTCAVLGLRQRYAESGSRISEAAIGDRLNLNQQRVSEIIAAARAAWGTYVK